VKPDVVVAVLGHPSHGRTTVSTALANVTGREHTVAEQYLRTVPGDRQLVRAKMERRYGLEGPAPSYRPALAIADGEAARLFLEDCPGVRDYVKNTARAISVSDAALLVVDVLEGVDAQTREHLHIARALGVDQVVVLLSKCDQVHDLELLDAAELEARAAMIDAGLDGDDAVFVRGAAERSILGDGIWRESMRRLLRALEPLRPRERRAGPLRLDVYQCFRARGGYVVQGRLEGGEVTAGDTLEVVGSGARYPVEVTRVEVGREEVERGEAGQLVGLRLRSGRRPRSGAALGRPGELATTQRFAAELHLSEGLRHTPVLSGSTAHLICGAAAVEGRLSFVDEARVALAPGERARVVFDLVRDIPEPSRFVMRDGTTPFATLEGGRLIPTWGGTVGRGERVT
jgi:elongation factor Tu